MYCKAELSWQEYKKLKCCGDNACSVYMSCYGKNVRSRECNDNNATCYDNSARSRNLMVAIQSIDVMVSVQK
jgi:hypothetical protein